MMAVNLTMTCHTPTDGGAGLAVRFASSGDPMSISTSISTAVRQPTAPAATSPGQRAATGGDHVVGDVMLVGPGIDRRLSPRRTTATKVRVGSTGAMTTSWAALICDASASGLLVCCELHPEFELGSSVTIEDSEGRWAIGTIVRAAPHPHWRLRYYGVALTQVSGELESQFPAAGLHDRERLLEQLVRRVGAR
jgi:hypothetical protein